jgi:small-conductance mechanosensitive channel
LKPATPAQDAWNSLADGAGQILSNALERLFGPAVHDRILGSVTWVDVGVVICVLLLGLLSNALIALVLHRKRREASADSGSGDWRRHVFDAVGKPSHLLIWVFGAYVAAATLVPKLPSRPEIQAASLTLDRMFDIGLFVVLFWLFFRFTRVLDQLLAAWARRTPSKLDDILAPLVGQSLRIIVPVIGIIFALPLLGLSGNYASLVAKASSILIICAVSWIISRAVHLGEQGVLAKFDITVADNLHARKVYTQVHVISKTLYVLIAIFTVASVLMLFEEARRFGTSILASAGVVGVILGFAAQHTIANLFAGFQVALTQPIRLDDVVIVEGEWGRVEEITLTYVVVHIWDDRRMVLPLSYFIEKPFQNWTRVSAALMGSVFLWTDYTLPVAEVRQAVQKIVEGSSLWDRRFWNLQVSDATEHTMQLRVLATAADASKAWDLRCEIRERLIEFVQQHHPGSLPKTRMDLKRPSNGESGRITNLAEMSNGRR